MNLKNLEINLFLIRHAHPENLPGHWTSPSSPLSGVGIKQAKSVAQELQTRVFSDFIASPFVRTRQTANYIHDTLNIKPSLNEQEWLAEIDLGVWAGKYKSEIKEDPSYPKFFPMNKVGRHEPLVARLLNTHKEFKFPRGESLQAFWNRVSQGFVSLIDQKRSGKEHQIALIGHGGSFTIIQSLLLGKKFTDTQFPVMVIKMGRYAHIRIFKERVVYLQLN
ncbi:MAG: histidine phosphatase family protein [Candidatus Hodarchaeales archaeon]